MVMQNGQLRLLTRHFFRRFLDNDLVSSGSDLHAPLAAALSGLIVIPSAVVVLLAAKYSAQTTRSVTEILALAVDDRTLLIGGAMIMMALVAGLEWDALALDQRDVAVLGPLPIPSRTLVMAKTLALGIFVGVTAICVTVVPSVFFPLVALNGAHVGLAQLAREIVAQAVGQLSGCMFIFLGFVAVRGLLAAATPARVSRLLLAGIHAVLFPAVLVLLFVLPGLSTRVHAMVQVGSSSLAAWPALWFVAIEEVLAGRRDPVFTELSRVGFLALGLAAFGAVAAQFGGLMHAVASDAGTGKHRRWRVLDLLSVIAVRDPVARASFLFTVRALIRSPLQRSHLVVHLGAALGVVGAVYEALRVSGLPANPEKFLPFMTATLLFFLTIAVRDAASFPVDPRARWIFRLLTIDSLDRQFVGVRSAVVTVFALPLLLVLAPLYAWSWGWYGAFVHLGCGLLLASSLLEMFVRSSDRVPFVSDYVPSATVLAPKALAYVLGYFALIYVAVELEPILLTASNLFFVWAIPLAVMLRRLIVPRRAKPGRPHAPITFDAAVDDAIQLRLDYVRGSDPHDRP